MIHHIADRTRRSPHSKKERNRGFLPGQKRKSFVHGTHRKEPISDIQAGRSLEVPFAGAASRSAPSGRSIKVCCLAYLKATLTAIANGHPQSRIDDLLPWNFTPSS
jgi:hypothetical protein